MPSTTTPRPRPPGAKLPPPPGALTTGLPQFPRCPACGAAMGMKDIVCLECGHTLKGGKKTDSGKTRRLVLIAMAFLVALTLAWLFLFPALTKGRQTAANHSAEPAVRDR